MPLTQIQKIASSIEIYFFAKISMSSWQSLFLVTTTEVTLLVVNRLIRLFLEDQDK